MLIALVKVNTVNYINIPAVCVLPADVQIHRGTAFSSQVLNLLVQN